MDLITESYVLRQVSPHAFDEKAKEFKTIAHFECSAKENTNIDIIFETIVNHYMENEENGLKDVESIQPMLQQPKKKKKCGC
eukprot:CAMPEP_0117421302 /NCGR_PEP_ID=MMETSP0758-20121206/2436_1 /TAXON_ID=63605 /ORGANISM="Percolomonas cosmopolitus, Strain AE-1 (ATCC 50343)" /LENGTH=81 /DNA_ID=CAMNT_0005203375 /DNA_START=304 /DNA_END=549 /DNA_ORIENTATION=+